MKVLGLWFLVRVCNSDPSIRKILPINTKPLCSGVLGAQKILKKSLFLIFLLFGIHNGTYGPITIFCLLSGNKFKNEIFMTPTNLANSDSIQSFWCFSWQHQCICLWIWHSCKAITLLDKTVQTQVVIQPNLQKHY